MKTNKLETPKTMPTRLRFLTPTTSDPIASFFLSHQSHHDCFAILFYPIRRSTLPAFFSISHYPSILCLISLCNYRLMKHNLSTSNCSGCILTSFFKYFFLINSIKIFLHSN
jgi:hypothetical protein